MNRALLVGFMERIRGRPPWVIVALAAATLASFTLTAVLVGISDLEFHHALWTKNVEFRPPAIVEAFRSLYPWFKALPWVTLLIDLALIFGRLRRVVMSLCVSVIVLVHLVFVLFWLMAVYFANQSFMM